MCTPQEPIEEAGNVKDESNAKYWQNKMKNDVQFLQYMTEVYKKQHLEQFESQEKEEINKQMTHHLHIRARPRHLRHPIAPHRPPSLMDHMILDSCSQEQQGNEQLNCAGTTRSSSDYPNTVKNNHASSTPRRPLDDSSSSEKQPQRRYKKPRPYDLTTVNTPPNPMSSSSAQHFKFSAPQLKHAVTHKLPCFYIKFMDKSEQSKLPSVMNVARWIRQTVQQETIQSIGEFSLFIPAGKNRYKFGVASKADFLKLWNCKWPEKMNQLQVEIERPRSLPDCCALVVRYIPADLSNEFVVQEITKSIKSAVAFSRIKYYRQRATNDYRFGVLDINEYEEMLNIGRIAIGHLLLPITAFISGLQMTYCTNCWELGHIRPQCKVGPRCRNCQQVWHHNHQCDNQVCCAQCKGPHSSLSMECPVVRNYRQALKEEVNMAIKDGSLRPMDITNKPNTGYSKVSEPSKIKQTVVVQPAWTYQHNPVMKTQNQNGNEQIKELMDQMNDVLEITRRLESKMDNQVVKVQILDKKTTINEQSIMMLVNIMQQIINTTLGKKNKQHFQNIFQQLEEFKTNILEKFNELSGDQQSTYDAETIQNGYKSTNKPAAKRTTSSKNANSNQDEQERSMELTNEL